VATLAFWLQVIDFEGVRRILVRKTFLIHWTIAFASVAAIAFSLPRLVTSTHQRAHPRTRETGSCVTQAARPLAQPAGDEAIGAAVDVDVAGNEVVAAIAKYKIDATGSLYELHSPQTDLPHLSSPKT
jgi:hypothetical protein